MHLCCLLRYKSAGPNCSGHADSCNSDIVQSPVNFSTLEDRYAEFATEFIANVSVDPGIVGGGRCNDP